MKAADKSSAAFFLSQVDIAWPFRRKLNQLSEPALELRLWNISRGIPLKHLFDDGRKTSGSTIRALLSEERQKCQKRQSCNAFDDWP